MVLLAIGEDEILAPLLKVSFDHIAYEYYSHHTSLLELLYPCLFHP